MHTKWLRLTSLIAMVAAYGISVQSPAFAAKLQLPIRQVQIVDESMCCAGCARKVSGQLYTMRGVKEVGVDMNSRTLTVSLPAPSPAMLGQLWHAVEQGDGTPAKLVTAEATYTLVRPHVDPANQSPRAVELAIVIEDLHRNGCAEKIAAELYLLKGVSKVSVDKEKATLLVESHSKVKLSPWSLIDAVAKTKERPRAILGSHGELRIEYVSKAVSKHHQKAQQTQQGGIQR